MCASFLLASDGAWIFKNLFLSGVSCHFTVIALFLFFSCFESATLECGCGWSDRVRAIPASALHCVIAFCGEDRSLKLSLVSALPIVHSRNRIQHTAFFCKLCRGSSIGATLVSALPIVYPRGRIQGTADFSYLNSATLERGLR